MFLSAFRRKFRRPGLLLHIGAGDKDLPGWINIDRADGPGIDLVADVREAGGGHEADVAGADDGDVHRASLPETC